MKSKMIQGKYRDWKYIVVPVLAGLCLLLGCLNLNSMVTFAEPLPNPVTVYVNQEIGSDDTGDGTESKPYQTMDKAALDLTKAENGGTIETNIIVIQGTYTATNSKSLFEEKNSVPVTITGGALTNKANGSEWQFPLNNDMRLENLQIIRNTQQPNQSVHIYGNGHNITLGNGVDNQVADKSCGIYLYGAKQTEWTTGDTVGKIEVYSGSITRIAGYGRGGGVPAEVQGKKANITVGGTANVSMIIAGSASCGIKNGGAEINVTGGSVTTLVGGNHGFSQNISDFVGDTTINISGGNVSNVLGAGKGRERSIPTFTGDLRINMTGGSVGNIYGAGSAAFVKSGESQSSNVNISVTGGTVKNIFAAGQGGDATVVEKAGEEFTNSPADFGSLTGEASISVGGSAVVTGNIYASGEGLESNSYDTTNNAYLDGSATVTLTAGTVKGNIYGGGKGISTDGYEKCARVTGNSTVKVRVTGGTIEGNVYGGGENGLVEGRTAVEISNGTINGSVYGGALGITGKRLVLGGSTVNMTGGWVRGNLYGGSELSNDGPVANQDLTDRIFVNLAGGIVDGNVFGGGYRGIVNGSTHLHIGLHAPEKCAYYESHAEEMPVLVASKLQIGGSVYAGGDYGGGSTLDYSAITVTGTSHVYIDGTDYNTGSTGGSQPEMLIASGIFGSGASCDAGSTRLVTLDHYGSSVKDGADAAIDATRTLTAIQRADRVLLLNSHVRLTGQSDIANPDQTALYSLNRIGDHDGTSLTGLGSGLVLQGGSTAVLDAPVTETSRFSSVDKTGLPVALDAVQTVVNTVRFETGVVFRISYTGADGQEIFGEVSGYAWMIADDKASAYAYARAKTDSLNTNDGGFVSSLSSGELPYTNVETTYRYWKIQGQNATAVRSTVLTAQNVETPDKENFAVAKGVIELPPSGNAVTYTIASVTLPDGVVLTEAAKDSKDAWVTTAANPTDNITEEKKKIANSPGNTFGLYMNAGTNFNKESGIIISQQSVSGLNNREIGSAGSNQIPMLEFYLTYYNAISVSKNLGTVQIQLHGDDGSVITMNVDLVTKASALSDQTVDLYATQSGSYTGTLTIPAGDSRDLKLTKVASLSGDDFKDANSALSGNQFSITMQPKKSQGWNSAGLMATPYDLKQAVPVAGLAVGTTDSRYSADLTFNLKNAPGFAEKGNVDTVTLTFADGADEFVVTLQIRWEPSVVAKIEKMAGRQYNGMADEAAPVIAQKNALTAAFTLNKNVSSDDIWLELQAKGGTAATLPEGTQLTLLDGANYYCYQVTGSENNGKVPLSALCKMWGTETMKSTFQKDQTLTVILDFNDNNAELKPGDYSLRLRTETGADTQGADFTVNNSMVQVELSGDGVISQKEQTFTLNVVTNSDSRLLDGAQAVFSLKGERKTFPEGTVFTYGGQAYYPAGGRVFIPLKKGENHSITVSIPSTIGLSGELTLVAKVFPVGWNAGQAGDLGGNEFTYQVQNTAYGLKVEQTPETRYVKPGAKLSFDLTYTAEEDAEFSAALFKKTGKESYSTTAAAWETAPLFTQQGGNKKIAAIMVPSAAEKGKTYRIVFRLQTGDTVIEVPYNIMISDE